MRFKRQAGRWKADVSEPVYHASLVKMLTSMDRSAKALQSVNPPVEHGKFKSQSEANQAMERARRTPPATAPVS